MDVAKLNVPVLEKETTHGGAKAWPHATNEQKLQRSVLSCMLWEDAFYEEGQAVADRIKEYAEIVPVSTLASLAIEARSQFHLRHVPLLLLSILARRASGSSLVSETVGKTIQRADELAEFLAVYAKVNGVEPKAVKKKLSAQVKKGLALAFPAFDSYQLGKYDRAGAVRLRDALFLCHAVPKDDAQAEVWKQLVSGTLPCPDTWESALVGGADKKATFERLMRERKLGYLALLKNLRGMLDAGCDAGLIRETLAACKGADRVFPFRFIAAAKAAPKLEEAIDQAFLATLGASEKLPGKTVFIIDVSGSMYGSAVSKKSDMTRALAACALGAIGRELCEEPVVYATAGSDYERKHKTEIVPARRGMALVDVIHNLSNPLGGGGIFLKQVMDYVFEREKSADRIIVITDEQDCSNTSEDNPRNANAFGKQNYLINVSSDKNGIGYGKWTHVDGFSEQVFRYILESERGNQISQN